MRLSDVLSKPPNDQFEQVEGFLDGRRLRVGKQKKIRIGKVALPFFCKDCTDNLTFCSGDELFCIGVNDRTVSVDCVLTCPRCSTASVPTWFLVACDVDISARDPNVRIQKRNHKLPVTVSPNTERFGHFSGLLEKARQAHAEGLGAGSIVYLRKILEIITTQAAATVEIKSQTNNGRRKPFKDFLQEVDQSCSIIPREFSRNGYRLFGELSNVLHAEYDEELAEYSDTRIHADDLTPENYVGVDNILQNRAGKTTSNYVPQAGKFTSYERNDILLGNIRPYLKKIWHADRVGGTNGDVLVVRIRKEQKDAISPRYLYQILADDKFFDYAMQTAKGAKMPRGNKAMIMKYEIPVPPLAEQERIISILDKFDTLVNDLSSGLPAEIAARRQQYEHYRDRLLTFQEAA